MLYTVTQTGRGDVCFASRESGYHYSDRRNSPCDYCVGALREQIDYLAPVVPLIPREDEMGSAGIPCFGGIERELPLQVYHPNNTFFSAFLHAFQFPIRRMGMYQNSFLSKWGVSKRG